MQGNNILDFLEPLVLERLGKILVDNDEYNEKIDKETIYYERLKENLKKEQQRQLEEYFNSVNETSVFCQELAYRQGMADLLIFIGNLIFK